MLLGFLQLRCPDDSIKRGIPVATVGISNSTNAALLAIRILGTSIPSLTAESETYAENLKTEVLAKADKLETLGWDEYTRTVLKK